MKEQLLVPSQLFHIDDSLVHSFKNMAIDFTDKDYDLTFSQISLRKFRRQYIYFLVYVNKCLYFFYGGIVEIFVLEGMIWFHLFKTFQNRADKNSLRWIHQK